MTNSIGYANPAAVNFGTLALESLRVSDREKAKAAEVVCSYMPLNDSRTILSMLGIDQSIADELLSEEEPESESERINEMLDELGIDRLPEQEEK